MYLFLTVGLFDEDGTVFFCCTVFNHICSVFTTSYLNLLSEIFPLWFVFVIRHQQFFYIPQMLSAELMRIMYIVCLYSSRWLGVLIGSVRGVERSVYEIDVYNGGFC